MRLAENSLWLVVSERVGWRLLSDGLRQLTMISTLGFLPALASAAEPDFAYFQREIQPILARYCYDCHGDGIAKGGVTLDEFSDAAALRDHDVWLRALRNVRSGIMPPADEAQLPAEEAEKLMRWIKREAFGLDSARPDPGRLTVRRLNRVEYRNTIRELMGVDFDTSKEFPADDTGHGFDTIADVLTISPMLMERYLDAAQTIVSRAVVTTPRSVTETSVPGKQFRTVKVDTTLPVPTLPPADAGATGSAGVPVTPPAAKAQVRGSGRTRSGPPPATRPLPAVDGNTLVLSYYTPAVVAAKQRLTHSGAYQVVIDLTAHETYADDLFDLNKCGLTFMLDGKILHEQEYVREGYSKKFEFVIERELKSGEHELTIEVAPLGPDAAQYRKLRMRVNAVVFRGPLAREFWSPSAGYDKYFPRAVPTTAPARREYAREVLAKFASRAFRGRVDPVTLDRLVALAEMVYTQPSHSFEGGVAQAMVAVLASPSFIFREERTQPLRPGQSHPFIDEYALASRLSYFFWSSMPDGELLRLAASGRLRANQAAQVKRLLSDPRAQEFVRNFPGQWLQARDIASVAINADDVYLRDHPDPGYQEARDTLRRIQAIPAARRTPEEFAAQAKARGVAAEFSRRSKPELNESLRQAMLQETELTFARILKEDRSLLELLESDTTFLNEELAKHYGIEGVTGSKMRQVTLPADSPRGGILTQGTILAVTSNPTRTSPVKRGVFILEAILGTPPAPPPPNIPALEDAASAEVLRSMSLRDTLALHAQNPTCASCHSRMDPLGLALENFNAMGIWRTTDAGQPVQPAGKLITGETFSDIRELKRILVTSHRRDFYYCVSEKLLTYALGRGLEYYDIATLDQLVAALEAAGGRPSALMDGIVNSAPFQQRRQLVSASVDEVAKPAGAPQRVSLLTPASP